MQPEAKARLERCATAWQALVSAIALIFMGLVIGPGTSANAEEHLKRLLIIYPDSSESHAAVIASEAVRNRFSQLASGLTVQTHTEFLDRTQFPSKEHKDRFVQYLSDKFADSKPDAILAFGADSLEAAVSYRKLLATNTPIVFCVLPPAGVAVNFEPDMAGIVSEHDVTKTVALARRLQPNARNLVVVAGTAAFDRKGALIAQQQLADIEKQLKTRYLVGLPDETVERELASVPRNSIIVLLSKLTEGPGRGAASGDAASIISAANAPIYAPYSTYFGRGIVGGYMDTFDGMGTQTADLVLNILSGNESAASGPRRSTSQAFRVDARQLERWGLSAHDLPKGTAVAHKPPTLWESHPRIVTATIAMFTAMASVLMALLVQIARRKLAEANLKDSEKRMRFAAAAADIGLWQYDIQARRLWSSKHCRAMLGLPVREPLTTAALIGRVHPDDRHVARASIRAATFGTLNDGESEFRVVWPNGETRWLQARGRTDLDENGEPLRASGIFRDVTNYKIAQLEAKHLSQRVLSIQDDERQRIAQDLHDSTSQHLAAIGLNLIALKGSKGSCSVLEDIENSLDEASKELRTFTYLLHPPALADDGLIGTLGRYVEGFKRRTNLCVSLRSSGSIDELSRPAQESILRVVQEALANVHRHADASRAQVHLRRLGDHLHVVVSDDGIGLKASGDAALGTRLPTGVGIAGMTARMRQLGGSLHIRSKPNGTIVHAIVPIGAAPGVLLERQIAAE
jgi:PAS domain S-box-containing protein